MLGFEVRIVEKRPQVVDVRIDTEDDVAALAAVAAVRAASGDELLAAETDRTVAAVAGLS